MSAILIDGGLIHYETFGRGKPLVFVHGWLGSWRYWMPTMEDLAVKYRTYALDLWGFGDSDKRNRYRVADYVNLIGSFMDELGIWRTSLVGHALGGAISVRFAALHPDRVDRLLAVSLPITSEAISVKTLTLNSGTIFGRFFRQPAEYQPVIQEMNKTARDALETSVQSVMELDLRHDIARMEAPLLVVYGGKDNVVDPAQAKLLEDTDYSIRPMALDSARHFPMLEERSKFNRLLMDFLELDLSSNGNLKSLEFKEEWRRRTR
jgi:pimeloyl-ACP methyl ester carboxylesterase